MKVRIPLVIDVDPAKWAFINGQIADADGNFTIADFRADVRSYFLNHVQGSYMVEETDAEVIIA